MNVTYTWSMDWIQEYESPWGILEKFMYANVIDGNTVLELLGNENVTLLKNISNAGNVHRNLSDLSSIDSKKTELILGIDLIKYQNELTDKILQIIPKIRFKNKYFRENISYCPKCLSKGYHSIFHQIGLFDYCPFHTKQKLINYCFKCKKSMTEYILKRGRTEAYHCACGHCFLSSKNIKELYKSWKTRPIIRNEIISTWLKLPRNIIHNYHLIYPFDNYDKYHRFRNNDIDFLSNLPKLMIVAFNERDSEINTGVIKISSKKEIFKTRIDYLLLKENYIKSFPFRFVFSKFKEEDKIDSIFFDIYKQTRIIYKAITRYILRKIIYKHSKCVKIFNKANQIGDVCPHALAFIFWKMECEGINSFWELESHIKKTEPYNFECLKEDFSTDLQGAFMTHLDNILNLRYGESAIDFLKWNLRSIHYIVNKITSHLLVERYIKWLEVIQHPKKFPHIYPDDNIPMYLAKIPIDLNEEISFFFPNHRAQYMKSIIEDISRRKKCPTKKSIQYPPYKSPLRLALDKMDKDYQDAYG